MAICYYHYPASYPPPYRLLDKLSQLSRGARIAGGGNVRTHSAKRKLFLFSYVLFCTRSSSVWDKSFLRDSRVMCKFNPTSAKQFSINLETRKIASRMASFVI